VERATRLFLSLSLSPTPFLPSRPIPVDGEEWKSLASLLVQERAFYSQEEVGGHFLFVLSFPTSHLFSISASLYRLFLSSCLSPVVSQDHSSTFVLGTRRGAVRSRSLKTEDLRGHFLFPFLLSFPSTFPRQNQYFRYDRRTNLRSHPLWDGSDERE